MPTDDDRDTSTATADASESHTARADLEFFDDLMMTGVSLRTLVESVARRIEGSAGAQDAGGEWTTAGASPPGACPVRVSRQTPAGLGVWIQPSGSTLQQGSHFLERFAVAAVVAASRRNPAITSSTEYSLIDLLDGSFESIQRSRLPDAIGLPADVLLRVFAIKGPEPQRSIMADRIAERVTWSRTGTSLDLTAVLARGEIPDLDAVPLGVRVGISSEKPARSASTAWVEAKDALRFCLPSTREHGPYTYTDAVVVSWQTIGAFRILPAALTNEQIDRDPDLLALATLTHEGGDDILRILETVAANESIRKAAQHLYLHHNSVASRVERAERVLGFTVTEPYGRARLLLALVLRRLRDSNDERRD